MTYIIAEPCVDVRDRACVEVCPVDCIETEPFKLHDIDLDVCTRCDACLPVCPTDAILAGSR